MSESDVSLQLHGSSLTQNLLATNLLNSNQVSFQLVFSEGFCHFRWADSGGLAEMQVIKMNSVLCFRSPLHVESECDRPILY